MVAEVGSGAVVVGGGMAVQPFGFRSTGVDVRPEGIAVRKVASELNSACQSHVSYIAELRQVRWMY